MCPAIYDHPMCDESREYIRSRAQRIEGRENWQPFRSRWDRTDHNPLPCLIRHCGTTQVIDTRFSCSEEFDMFLDVGTLGIFCLVECLLRMRPPHIGTLSPFVLD